MRKTFEKISQRIVDYLNKPKIKNLNHWKIFTVAIGLLLIGMLCTEQRYERAQFVFVLAIITYVIITIKEKQNS